MTTRLTRTADPARSQRRGAERHVGDGGDGAAAASTAALRCAADLSAFILAHPTATSALEAWCQRQGLSQGPVWARLLAPVTAVTPPPAVAADLQLTVGETVLLRQVALMRGPMVLAEADNWFVPGRLPADMAAALLTTETPFGRLIAPLGGYRIETRVDLGGAAEHDPERIGSGIALFEHHAVVCRRSDPVAGPAGAVSNVRLAAVHERFLSTLLPRQPVAAPGPGDPPAPSKRPA